MKRLTLGKMSRKDLASWFGVSYGTFRNKSEYYFDLLKDYCVFDIVYGSIEIKEIDIPVFDKDRNIKNEKMFMEEIQSCIDNQDGLSTIAGMARKFTFQGQFNRTNTAERSLRKIGNRLFGETKKLSSYGEKGRREYIWAIKVDDLNIYRLMTPEEEKIFDELIGAYYSSSVDKIKQLALLDELFKTTDMEKQDYLFKKESLGLDLFSDVLQKFKEETGLQVVKCTKHELGEFHDWDIKSGTYDF